jgi:transcriptional regulator with XRE-family HTH domain
LRAWKAICNERSAATCAPTEKPRASAKIAFADEIGVHRTYMGGVERGERNLTLKSLERIASQIDVDPLALLQPADDAE